MPQEKTGATASEDQHSMHYAVAAKIVPATVPGQIRVGEIVISSQLASKHCKHIRCEQVTQPHEQGRHDDLSLPSETLSDALLQHQNIQPQPTIVLYPPQPDAYMHDAYEQWQHQAWLSPPVSFSMIYRISKDRLPEVRRQT